MQLREATALIKNNYLLHREAASVWADFGCGSGLFTRALSHYLKPGSCIYAVDRANRPAPDKVNTGVDVIPLQADFETDDLPVEKLDGILMANSLHYVKDKQAFLARCKQKFSNETFLVVEYDTDIPVPRWVPYPLSFSLLTLLFRDAGFNQITRLSERPSSYGRNMMYAALIR